MSRQDTPDSEALWRKLRVPKWIVKEKYAWEKLPKEPLLVRCELLSPYTAAESKSGAIHLDALLSAAAVRELPYPPPPHPEGEIFPTPLELAWVSLDGLPLWTASDLRPQGDIMRDATYWHKRHPEDRNHLASDMRANTRAGARKEYRMPISRIQVAELRAICIGHRSTVQYLLERHIPYIGKKSSQGGGAVGRWTVETLESPVKDARGAALRGCPVPLDALEDLGEAATGNLSVFRGGFSPPYWHAPGHTACVTRG